MKPILLAALLGLAAAGPASAQGQTSPQQTGPQQTLHLFSLGGIFQDNYIPVVVKPFEDATGIKVQYSSAPTSAVQLGQLRTQKGDPEYDAVLMDASIAMAGCAENLFEPVTPATLPVINQLDPRAIALGGKCGPAVTFDDFVVAYDTQALPTPPTSLKDMWDAKWRGRISVSAPPNIIGLVLTAILADADTGDWKNANGAFRELRALAPSVQTFDPQPDGYTLILNNTVTWSTAWNARSQLYHDLSKGRIGILVPKEGTVFQANTINLIRGAHNREAALKFIDYALSATAQRAFAERMFYGPTNLHSDTPPDVLARTAVGQTAHAKFIALDWEEMVRLREPWNQRWRREVISAGGR